MNVSLKKWDNCYTFMLKYLRLFPYFFEIESNEFVDLFEKERDLKVLNNNDVVVWETIDEEDYYSNREFTNGVLVNKKYEPALHFATVYLDKYLIDLTYVDSINTIRIREISKVNFNKNSYKIKYENIKVERKPIDTK